MQVVDGAGHVMYRDVTSVGWADSSSTCAHILVYGEFMTLCNFPLLASQL